MPFGRAIGFPTIWKARAYRGGCSAAQGSLSLRAGERRRGNPGYWFTQAQRREDKVRPSLRLRAFAGDLFSFWIASFPGSGPGSS
jgi:hypothetical protein